MREIEYQEIRMLPFTLSLSLSRSVFGRPFSYRIIPIGLDKRRGRSEGRTLFIGSGRSVVIKLRVAHWSKFIRRRCCNQYETQFISRRYWSDRGAPD